VGFGLIEIIMAVGLWAILGGSAMILILGGLRTNRLADESGTASQYAAEGIDAVEAMSKQAWLSPLLADCSAGCGLATSAGTWAFSGLNDTYEKFSRQMFVSPAYRDGLGNIVNTGGSVDTNTYRLESRVTWSRGIPAITNTISLISYLTNYADNIMSVVAGGLMIYGDGANIPKFRS
jgi:type II secretory pathway pseudopilin PulG